MKDSFQDDEVQRLREQLRRRIDVAAKSVAEALQAVADLWFAIAPQEAEPEVRVDKVQVQPVPAMMTTEQAAEYLGLKAQTLAVWRCTGRYSLPFVKVGSNTRYRKTDVDAFLHRRTKKSGCDEDFR